MARPDQIPTDLTLEIGDDPSPERFLRAATAFFGYVTEIGKLVAPEGEVPRWVVRVREGSNLLALEPADDVVTQWHTATRHRAAHGARVLVDDGVEAAGLPEQALRHLTVLSEITSGPRERPTKILIWFQRQPMEIGPTIAAKVREEDRLGYQDFGTVEGTMDTVQDRNGNLQFRVRDAVLGQTVHCYISEGQLEEAFGVFRKRVEVSGVVNYRRNGTPISIHAERIERLPDDDDLPSPDDVRGILRLA